MEKLIKNYRFLPGLVLLGILGLSIGSALALSGGPTLTVQLSPASVGAGNQFTANLVMDTKTYSVSAAELHLTFPADKLQAISIVGGPFLATTLQEGVIGNGAAAITVASGVTAKQGTGVVAVVTFKALTTGTARIDFASNTQVAAISQSTNVVDTMTGANETITSTPGYTYVPTTTPYQSALPVYQVSTGPGETTLFALIVGCIAVLLYVGYTKTDVFRRHEANGIASHERNEPSDFKP